MYSERNLQPRQLLRHVPQPLAERGVLRERLGRRHLHVVEVEAAVDVVEHLHIEPHLWRRQRCGGGRTPVPRERVVAPRRVGGGGRAVRLSRPRRSLSHRWPGQRAQLCTIHVSGHPPVAVAPRGEFRKQTNCLSVAASPVAVAPSANVLGYVLCICLATRRRRRTENIARHTWLNFTVHGAPIAHRTTFYNHFSIVPCGGQIVFAHLSPTDPSPPHRGDHRWGNPPIVCPAAFFSSAAFLAAASMASPSTRSGTSSSPASSYFLHKPDSAKAPQISHFMERH